MSAHKVDHRQRPTSQTPDPAVSRPGSRRALLAGLAGGAGALIANAMSRVPGVRGVVANPVLMGSVNDAGNATTTLTSSSFGGNQSLVVINTSSGTAIKGNAEKGNGGQFRTQVSRKFGLQANNDAAGTGSGAAFRALGRNNTAIVATTNEGSRSAIDATNTDTTADNVAVKGLAYNADPADTHPSGG